MLAKSYMLQCFTLSTLADCGGDEEIPKDAALKEGKEVIEEALKIFKEVGWLLNMRINAELWNMIDS